MTKIIWLGALLLIVMTWTSLAEQQVCCSKTLSGATCASVPESECQPGALQAATSCEQTSFCSTGCGYVQEDGLCFNNMAKFSCENTEGCSWTPEAACNIPQCQRGCCVLSNECSFTTQVACKATTSQFEHVNMTFIEGITSELECTNQCRSFERGACVAPDASCVFTTRESCPYQTPSSATFSKPAVGFHPNKLCSQPDLGTECAPQQRTGCLPEAEEVYWVDSCGNPENIYSSNKQQSFNNGYVLSKEESCSSGQSNANNPNCGNCNYNLGSLCLPAEDGVEPAFGDFICGDLSCDAGDITQDPNSPASSSPKDLGESWCAYDAPPGFAQDPVGSRQYRRLCINGQELTEPCADFREELCIQGVAGEEAFETTASFTLSDRGDGFSAAACRANRWDGCGDIDNEYECNNILLRDCFWIGEHQEEVEDQKENILGSCVPLVAPGLKFWPEQAASATPGADAQAACEKASTESTVVYSNPGIGLFSGRKCIANCQVESKEWLLAMNTQCVAQGDCGAWVNVLGKGTPDGFSVSPNHPYRITDEDLRNFGVTVTLVDGDDPGKFSAFFQKTWMPVSYFAVAALYISHEFGRAAAGAFVKTTLLEGFGKEHFVGDAWKAAVDKIAADKVAADLAAKTAADLAAKALADPSLQAAADLAAKTAADLAAKTALPSAPALAIPPPTPLPPIFGYINTLMWVWTFYNIIDILLTETEEITYSVSCQPWIAPEGGSDCELCNQRPGKECSEYYCKSLGQTCELVNSGTKNELCVDKHPNDVSGPVLQANGEDMNIPFREQSGEGFELSQLVPPFTPVTLSIATDEPSQCKWDIKPGTAFENTASFFGDSLYRYTHTLLFAVPDAFTQDEVLQVTNGGKYTLYVRCQDASGNPTTRDYFIKFGVEVGPDLTPPVIELLSIANGAYMPADTNKTALTIYVNEPSECKWDTFDGPFDTMAQTFACTTNQLPTSSLYYGLYECTTLLDGIQQQKKSTYYFRCRDQPTKPAEERNINTESYVFTLQGTVPLKITNVQPQEGVELFTPEIELRVTTSAGALGGIATCGYNFVDNNPQNAIDFANTNSTVHTQLFTSLEEGAYTAYITCIDVAGNLAQDDTSFTVSVDTNAPQLVQVFTEGSLLVLVMNEVSTCEYSTTGSFAYGTGIRMTGEMTIEHQASLDSSIYYVACIDAFENVGDYTIYI